MAGQQLIAPAPLPAAIEEAVVDALDVAHRADPFLPSDARSAAHRVVAIVGDVGVRARVLRGSLDLGGVELEHLFAVVADRVVDLAMPVNDGGFRDVVRSFVAGDVGSDELVRASVSLDLASRVVGVYPPSLRYRGAPLWGATA